MYNENYKTLLKEIKTYIHGNTSHVHGLEDYTGSPAILKQIMPMKPFVSPNGIKWRVSLAFRKFTLCHLLSGRTYISMLMASLVKAKILFGFLSVTHVGLL